MMHQAFLSTFLLVTMAACVAPGTRNQQVTQDALRVLVLTTPKSTPAKNEARLAEFEQLLLGLPGVTRLSSVYSEGQVYVEVRFSIKAGTPDPMPQVEEGLATFRAAHPQIQFEEI